MTSQTKHFIQLTDVIGMRFECKECKSELLLPMKGEFAIAIRQCPRCRADWAECGASTYEQVFEKFFSALKHIETIEQHVGFTFTLQVAPEPSAGKQ